MKWKKSIIWYISFIFLFATVVGTLPVTAAEVRSEIYVATAENGGSDSNSGTIDSPFLTLQRAADEVASIKQTSGLPAGGITVYLREGEYAAMQRVSLTSRHSGQEGAPVTFRSYPGETATVTGAKTVPSDAFVPANEQAKARVFDETAREKLLEVDLDDYGINVGNIIPTGFANGDGIAPAELFFDGVPMTLSRWPNKEMVAIDTDVDPTPDGSGNFPNYFQYGDTRIESWQWNDDLWVRGYFVASGWGDSTYHIDRIDTENKRIYTPQAPPYAGFNKTGKYYYYINILEEIDMPGEYYIDRTDNKLYFYPPYDVSLGKVQVSHTEDYLVSVSGGSYINFTDLIFEGTKETALDIRQSDHVVIDGCVIRNTGRRAANIDGCSNSGIKNSEMKYTGGGGVYLYGGNRNTLEAGNLFAENNHITDYQRIVRTYKPAVDMAGSGLRAVNNTIHDSPHVGILFHGSEMQVENNEIYDVTQETDDSGAIYTGRDYTYRGTVIRHNFIHDNYVNNPNAVGTIAIYLDDAMSSADVSENIISNVHRGMLLGGGRDHNIFNNLMVGCTLSITFDDRNKDVTPSDLLDPSKINYSQIAVDSAVWKEKYPEAAAMKDDPNPGYPKGNSLYNNVLYQSGDFQLSNLVTQYPGERGIQNNPTFTKDILLKDPEHFDYSLSAFSPVYTDLPEFSPISMEGIGVSFDEVANFEDYTLKLPQNGATGVDTADGVYFAWKASAYADRYRLTIARDADFQQIVRTVETEDSYATVSGLPASGNYYWKVESLQDAWSLPQSMAYDGVFTFTASGSAQAPGKVTGAVAYPGAQTPEGQTPVIVSWNAVSDADRYRIYRSEDGGEFTQLADGITELFYQDTAVQNGHTYRYKVYGVNAVGQAKEADEIPVLRIVDFDLSQTGTTVSAGQDSQVRITARLEDGGSVDLTGARVSYQVSQDAVFSVSETGYLQAKARGSAVLTVTLSTAGGADLSKNLFLTSYFQMPLSCGYEDTTQRYAKDQTTKYVRSGMYSVASSGQLYDDLYYNLAYGVTEVWMYDEGMPEVSGGYYFQPREGENVPPGVRMTIGIKEWNGANYVIDLDNKANPENGGQKVTPVERSVGWHQFIIETKESGGYSVYIDGVLCHTGTENMGGFDVFRYTGDQGKVFFDDLSVMEIAASPVATDLQITGAASWGAELTAAHGFYDYHGGSEQASRYQWYWADRADGDYQRIEGATEKTFVPGEDLAGKYLVCQVFPRAGDGREGEGAVSAAFGPLGEPYSVAMPTFTSGGVDITESGLVAGDISYTARFRNHAADALPLALIACAYDPGKPTQVKVLQTSAQTGVTELTGVFTGLSEEATIKFFYWDGLSTMGVVAMPTIFNADGLA